MEIREGIDRYMSEKCEFAYRKNGRAAVLCKMIPGDAPYCGHQYMCHVTKRWEANATVECTLRDKGRAERRG